MSTYFSHNDLTALANSHLLAGDLGLQLSYNRLLDLHKQLYSQFRNHNLYLHTHGHTSNPVSDDSVAGDTPAETITVNYLRSAAEAQMVERLIGRDSSDPAQQVEARFHPVIELRLSPDYFAVELILSPDAWWDQENLMNKLTIKRHLLGFHNLLQEMHDDYRLGFWGGVNLSDMHLTNKQLGSVQALDAWMATFEPGRDWFRVGAWYAAENYDACRLAPETFQHVKRLYRLYNFVTWTSNNNFQRKTATQSAN